MVLSTFYRKITAQEKARHLVEHEAIGLKGSLSAAEWDVIGNGSVDDQPSLKTAFSEAASEGYELVLEGSKGKSFGLGSTLEVTSHVHVKGLSKDAQFLAGANNMTLVDWKPSNSSFLNRHSLKSVQFNANGFTGCKGLYVSAGANSFHGDALTFTGLRYGLHHTGQFCKFTNISYGPSETESSSPSVALLISPVIGTYAGAGNNNEFSTFTSQSWDIGVAILGHHAIQPIWQALHDYAEGDLIVPTDPTSAPNCVFECTTAGTSDSGEPTWGTDFLDGGETFADDGIVWTARAMTPFGLNTFTNAVMLSSRLCPLVTYDIDQECQFINGSHEDSCTSASSTKTLGNITVNRCTEQISGSLIKFNGFGYADDHDPGIIMAGTPYFTKSVLNSSGVNYGGLRATVDDDSIILLTGQNQLYSRNDVSNITRGVVNIGELTVSGIKTAFLGSFGQTLDNSFPNSCYMTTGGKNSIIPYIDVSGVVSNTPTISPYPVTYDADLGPCVQIPFAAAAGSTTDNAIRVWTTENQYSGTSGVDSMAVGMMIKSDSDTQMAINAWQGMLAPTLDLTAGVPYYLFMYGVMNAATRDQVFHLYPVADDGPTISICRIHSIDSMNTTGYNLSMVSKLARGAYNPLQQDWIWRTDAAPTVGSWAVGYRILNETAAAGGGVYDGWRVVDDSPLAWKGFGLLET